MPTLRTNLSPLPPLTPFLVQRAQANEELQAALDDGLADYTEGAEVIIMALCDLLDEWVEEGERTLWATSEFGEPYKWLAIHEHLRVVREFRGLLIRPIGG